MNILDRQQILCTRCHPVARGWSLTFWTVPVLTGIVGDVLMVALGASCHMPAERLGPAGLNGGHHFELAETDMAFIGLPPRRTMVTEDVSNFQLEFIARQLLLAAARGGQLAGTYLGRSRRFSMFNCLSASNGLGVSQMVLVATWV